MRNRRCLLNLCMKNTISSRTITQVSVLATRRTPVVEIVSFIKKTVEFLKPALEPLSSDRQVNLQHASGTIS